MSIYGHYSHQYDGNRIQFPIESFTISGISHHKQNCEGICFNSELTMKYENDNTHDSSAIAIYFGEKKIGYVPNEKTIKKICSENINNKLIILNISTKIYGIRVLPECFYIKDTDLENKCMFADS